MVTVVILLKMFGFGQFGEELGERELKSRDGDWGKRERWPRSLKISF
jgi:hypothetical protein